MNSTQIRRRFTDFQQVPAERLAEIEAAGAISLFGEEYGSVVRVVVLGSEAQGKAAMVALLTADLAGDGAAARDVLVTAAKAVGGGAGGKGDLASAGGRDPGRLDEALRIARTDAVELLQGAAAG
jgi:alanyl-tRNA synthetase